MNITSESFDDQGPIPARCAFGKPDPQTHVTLSDNRSPQLAWSDAPAGFRSFVITCVDPDVPTVGDDVNQEGRLVPADLPRTDFVHWVMADVPADCHQLAEGAASQGVTARGKDDPPGPAGSRQGVNDYTAWFAGDADMGGTYLGYDGPCPPWNDERLHRYRFTVYALDLERLPVEGDFGLADVVRAMQGHILAEASITGTYTLNAQLVS